MLGFDFDGGGTVYICDFKDSDSHTKVGIKLVVGATGFYITRVQLLIGASGTPSITGNITLRILNSSGGAPINTAIGSPSGGLAILPSTSYPIAPATLSWPLHGAPSSLSVDIHGKPFQGEPINNSIDIIEDAYVEHLGGSETDLNSVDFTALRLIKTEEVSVNCDSEITFGDLLSKFERGQLFKFLPDLNGQYTVKQITASSPSVRTFYDEDMSNFSITKDTSMIFRNITINYGFDPTTRAVVVYEYFGNASLAEWLYGNFETFVLDVFLLNEADVVALAQRYAHLTSAPLFVVKFSVSSMAGFDLAPFQVITLNRSRAAWIGGAFSGIEFVILNVSKTAVSGMTTIESVLKSQMY
jgi:hypothetical protein